MNATNPRQPDSALILVVDDDRFMRTQLRSAMQQAGYQVVEASDGEQALATYTSLHPDVVLLDALMPVMDGFTCCAQLQALPHGDRTPVLMITALEEPASVDRAFAVGASDYITKPIHWAVLRQRVGRLLQASRATAALQQQIKWAQMREAHLRLALAAAHMGIWDWDILSNKVTYSISAESNLSLAPGSYPTENHTEYVGSYENFLKQVHPDDRELVKQAVQQAIAQRADYNIEFRLIWSDGTIHWLASSGQVYADDSGKVVRMTGIHMDITERQLAQEALQRQNQRSQLFAAIALKIRQSLQLEEILQTTVAEVQKLLQADRVLIFRLFLNGYGQIITESVVPGYPSVLGRGFTDDCFGEEYLMRYRQGRIYTIADIDKSEVQHCLVEFLQQFAVKAKLVMPILMKEELWGLLIAHQCSHPRQWSSFEVDLLRQLADQIGIALAQAQLLEQETKQRQELARSNSELQQFASIASHDLQEPLRKIQAFGNRLKAVCGDALNEPGRDYLERMQSAAGRMQALIDDLLTLSRITTRTQPFILVNLTEVTQQVLSDLEVQLQQTGGQVEVGNLPTIAADPIQMRQLLQNLISNALKFHRPGVSPVVKIYSQSLNLERLPVEGFTEAEFYQIIVQDNGIGFEEKYIDRIFNVFQRLHSRSEYEGTGMGLAICRKIAERHGGSITAKSTLGQGATFIVTLPLKQPKKESLE